MRNVDRPIGTTTDPRKSLRNRLQAVTAGTALAFMAGLAGAGAATEATGDVATDPVTATTAPAATLQGTEPGAEAKQNRAAPAKAARAKPAAPPQKQLHPKGIPGGQQTFTPTKEQLRNAKAIVDTGKKMKLPPRAWVIAVATATQESTLRNIGHLGASNDHDSQGLFQQRPSSGWGTPKQITNPEYASTAFYKALKNVDGYDTMALTDAAQTVQVSAYPDHYAKWEKLAGDIVKGLHGEGPYAKAAANLK